jgi:hypothetical protein
MEQVNESRDGHLSAKTIDFPVGVALLSIPILPSSFLKHRLMRLEM